MKFVNLECQTNCNPLNVIYMCLFMVRGIGQETEESIMYTKLTKNAAPSDFLISPE